MSPKGTSSPKNTKDKSAKSGAADVAADRVVAKFLQPDQGAATDPPAKAAEEAVKGFLDEDALALYNDVFVKLSVAERVASWKAYERERKTRKDKELMAPVPPELGDPKELYRSGDYTDFDDEGMPKTDADGKVLDKKTLAKLRKEFLIVKKLWDKYLDDKKKYEAWELGRARRANLVVDAEVEYPPEIEYLRPISPKTNLPMKVTLKFVPADPSKAVWSDELREVHGHAIDANVRKDKNVAKKLKDLPDRALQHVKEELVGKLAELSNNDPAIWEGVPIDGKKAKKMKKGEPKAPKEPKGLVDPAEFFQHGKNEGKFDEFDDEGFPAKKVTKKGPEELTEKEVVALRKQQEAAKKLWEKHQEALAKYDEDAKKFKEESGEADAPEEEGITEAQKRRHCEAAGLQIVRHFTDQIIQHALAERTLEVNRGDHDPPDLAAIVVKESIEEEEIITDPVLKAFRRFDQDLTNRTSCSNMSGLFAALKDDELQMEKWMFYGEVSDPEATFVQEKVADVGIAQGGEIGYEEFKTFIETSQVEEKVGKAPMNLVSCLLAMRVEAWTDGADLSGLFSPRSWRVRLEGGAEAEPAASPRGGRKTTVTDKKKGSASPRASPRGGEKAPADEEAPVSPTKTGRSSVSEGETPKRKSSSSKVDGKKEKKDKKDKGGEDEGDKKDKKKKAEKEEEAESPKKKDKEKKDKGDKKEKKDKKK